MKLPYHVVLSGGVGSRLWPISRKSQPKQYLRLFGGKSLFQLTLERNQALCQHTLVVGNKNNFLLSRADLAEAGIADYTEIIEATPRNTAAAIAFAAFAVPPESVLLITPSDHIITDAHAYQRAVEEATELAYTKKMVTFGLVPKRPETGYGYIEADGREVRSFREKPDAATAQAFCDSGRFLWNSGMFCFRADQFLTELHRYEPEIYDRARIAWDARDGAFLPEAESLRIPSQSVDYAVMERCTNINVIPAELGWSDLGSFEALWEYFLANSPEASFVQNNLVLGSKRHVEFIGLENVVLVETPDALLVIDKAQAQHVKQLYERLEREHPELVE
ncbi:mannose-1-phosphate guanylyltransferase [Arundinibacter roseus]|uniref:Mannose-1-phosphate guanylyltransferase n=1 Tax=Arundinibacter roseus TaxID=2070510 RepID=A0A4R4K7D3_9BACT|nr:sugar phosphate nucleotidyltransferase [Arundinibacter roseus]TDB63380.1 mannose-1-phosphate guanylyltransferase [Arundinibacter roseus]